MRFKPYLKGIVDVLVPKRCLLCGEVLLKGEYFCDKCLNFEKNYPPSCRKCGRTISLTSKTGVCPFCKGKKRYFDRIYSPFLFKPPLSDLIHLFKYTGHDFIGKILAEKLFQALTFGYYLNFKHYDGITFVPIHKQKLRERGFNQSFILAENISKHSGIKTADTLGVKHSLKSQTKKNYTDRQKAVKDNFYFKPGEKYKRLILIDDVFTTGATISECSKVLKENSVEEVFVITLSITPGRTETDS